MTDPLLRLLARTRTAETPVLGGLELRAVCDGFAGVTIITTGQGETASGTAVDSFTSVSLDPPLVLFCLHSQSCLRQVLGTAQTFTVNFFAQPQQDLAWAPATGETAVMRDFPHHISPAGLPVLSDALAHVGCRVTRQIDAGDQVIVLGTVIEQGLLPNGASAIPPFQGRDEWAR
ncbi:MAG: flavin reductase family protein [Jatrophihabitantaceae bacterium]